MHKNSENFFLFIKIFSKDFLYKTVILNHNSENYGSIISIGKKVNMLFFSYIQGWKNENNNQVWKVFQKKGICEQKHINKKCLGDFPASWIFPQFLLSRSNEIIFFSFFFIVIPSVEITLKSSECKQYTNGFRIHFYSGTRQKESCEITMDMSCLGRSLNQIPYIIWSV